MFGLLNKIPNNKFQIANKFQIQNSKTFWSFGFRSFDIICNLVLGNRNL